MTPAPLATVVCTSLALALGMVFAHAGLRKLGTLRASAEHIDAYQLLPAGSGRWIAPPLAAVEFLAGMACVLPASRPFGALLLALLLLVYSTAIGVNLARGRTDIDCGCTSLGGEPPLGRGLLLRNAVLLCAALGSASCAPSAPGSGAQWMVALLFASLLLGAYAVGNAWLARERWLRDD